MWDLRFIKYLFYKVCDLIRYNQNHNLSLRNGFLFNLLTPLVRIDMEYLRLLSHLVQIYLFYLA